MKAGYPTLTSFSFSLPDTTPTPPRTMSSPMLTLEEATWSWIYSGRSKHALPLGKRFTKAFMAGMLLSMGGMLVQILSADPWLATNAPGLLKILQGACFPVGLIMIVLLQMDLVTGQMAIMLMVRRGALRGLSYAQGH